MSFYGENGSLQSHQMPLMYLQIMHAFSVAPFDQNLSIDGRCLTDDSATLGSLGVIPECVIFLKVWVEKGNYFFIITEHLLKFYNFDFNKCRFILPPLMQIYTLFLWRFKSLKTENTFDNIMQFNSNKTQLQFSPFLKKKKCLFFPRLMNP